MTDRALIVDEGLVVRGLSAGYGRVPAIRAVDLRVDAGEVVALLGANGAGKTTTLASIAGVLPAMAGRISFDGKPFTGPLHRRSRQGLGFVSEERGVIRRLTTAQNLRLGSGDPAAALRLFPQLEPLLRRRAGLLSGGEQQMLALARTLAADPALLLVDELSFGLAPLVVRGLLRSVRTAADLGCAVLLVEQHPLRALSFADRGYVLTRGQITLSGASSDLRANLVEVERAYLADRPGG